MERKEKRKEREDKRKEKKVWKEGLVGGRKKD